MMQNPPKKPYYPLYGVFSVPKLVEIEPLNGSTVRLILDNDDTVVVRGTKKSIRKAVAGGNYQGIAVTYNQKLQMIKEDWAKIRPALCSHDLGPVLNSQVRLSYEELENLPQWAWRGGLRDYGSGYQNLFLYHPINLFRKRDDGNLYGIIREQDFPVDGQMTMWRLWDFNLQTGKYNLEKEEPRPNEYF